MTFFDINNIAFTLLDYPLSYIELIGTLFGLLSVYFASRANILTWPTGIVNELCFFCLFFQVHLYSGMLLQIYFFIATIYGWIYWHKNNNNNNNNDDTQITGLTPRKKLILTGIIFAGTLVLGVLTSQLHNLLPFLFEQKADFPFIDAFITVLSIAAMVLLARKIIDSWALWILVDIVSAVLYFYKGIYLIALEFSIFLVMASYGFFHWKTLKHD